MNRRLSVRRDRQRLVLEAVPRPDLVDAHRLVRGHEAAPSRATSRPRSTCSPSRTSDLLHPPVPRRGHDMLHLHRLQRRDAVAGAARRRPPRTWTPMTSPGIGAWSSAAPASPPAEARRAAPAARSGGGSRRKATLRPSTDDAGRVAVPGGERGSGASSAPPAASSIVRAVGAPPASATSRTRRAAVEPPAAAPRVACRAPASIRAAAAQAASRRARAAAAAATASGSVSSVVVRAVPVDHRREPDEPAQEREVRRQARAARSRRGRPASRASAVARSGAVGDDLREQRVEPPADDVAGLDPGVDPDPGLADRPERGRVARPADRDDPARRRAGTRSPGPRR